MQIEPCIWCSNDMVFYQYVLRENNQDFLLMVLGCITGKKSCEEARGYMNLERGYVFMDLLHATHLHQQEGRTSA